MIQKILNRMADYLDQEQLSRLEKIMKEEIPNEELCDNVDEINKTLIDRFVAQKKLEGCAGTTLEQYRRTNLKLLESIGKSAVQINKDDIRIYLADYQNDTGISNVTLNNMIRFISAFFRYLEDEDLILKNPMRKIKSVKVCSRVKPVLSQSELSIIKMNTVKERDIALIETLYSTGCRVSELCSLNISDLVNGEAVIMGKGGKERTIYFSDECIYHIQKYLDTRIDDCQALFVSMNYAARRITPGTVERIVSRIGKNHGIKIYPHKFRRTMATDLIRRGMRLEEVQVILGHSKIDTTMLYFLIDKDNVKNSHKRFIG